MKHFSLPKDGGLIEKGLPKDILHSKERIYTEILDTPYIASQMVADEVVAAIKAFKPTPAKPLFKLGLTTEILPSLFTTTFRGLVPRVRFHLPM